MELGFVQEVLAVQPFTNTLRRLGGRCRVRNDIPTALQISTRGQGSVLCLQDAEEVSLTREDAEQQLEVGC